MGERAMVAVVLEDDSGVRQLLDAILQTEGWDRVLGATWTDVEDAAGWCDLLLVDHRLPGPSGLEVVAEMRRRRPDLFIVMLTGERAAQERAEHLGVDGFLLKPFEVSALVDLLRAVREPVLDLRSTATAEAQVAATSIDLRTESTPWYVSS